MKEPSLINPRIVERLYCEALVLSDEVRNAFDLSGRIGDQDELEDFARVAMSCEGLRTTTRMMHAVAWLLNHRAYFMGELSQYQLTQHGRLSPNLKGSSAENLTLVEPHVRTVIEASDRFYARLIRLERQWLEGGEPEPPGAIDRLHDRIPRRVER